MNLPAVPFGNGRGILEISILNTCYGARLTYTNAMMEFIILSVHSFDTILLP